VKSFGSSASGLAGPGADLDLSLVGPPPTAPTEGGSIVQTQPPTFTKLLSKKEFKRLKPVQQESYLVWAAEHVEGFAESRPDWSRTDGAGEVVFTKPLSKKEYKRLKSAHQVAYCAWWDVEHAESSEGVRPDWLVAPPPFRNSGQNFLDKKEADEVPLFANPLSKNECKQLSPQQQEVYYTWAVANVEHFETDLSEWRTATSCKRTLSPRGRGNASGAADGAAMGNEGETAFMAEEKEKAKAKWKEKVIGNENENEKQKQEEKRQGKDEGREKEKGDGPPFSKALSKKEYRKLKPAHQDAYMVWALEHVVDFVTAKPEWLKTEKEKGLAREPVFTRELSTKEYRKLKPHQQDAYYRWVCNAHLLFILFYFFLFLSSFFLNRVIGKGNIPTSFAFQRQFVMCGLSGRS
jgi:hypothetical protein